VDLGVQVHHLIEQRFGDPIKAPLAHADVVAWQGSCASNCGDWTSLVLTIEEHKMYTDLWKEKIGYNTFPPGNLGVNTETATLDDIEQAAKEIYEDCPIILLTLGL